MKKGLYYAANRIGVYKADPWLRGYVHSDSLKKNANSSAINIDYKGNDRIIIFSDNHMFSKIDQPKFTKSEKLLFSGGPR